MGAVLVSDPAARTERARKPPVADVGARASPGVRGASRRARSNRGIAELRRIAAARCLTIRRNGVSATLTHATNRSRGTVRCRAAFQRGGFVARSRIGARAHATRACVAEVGRRILVRVHATLFRRNRTRGRAARDRARVASRTCSATGPRAGSLSFRRLTSRSPSG